MPPSARSGDRVAQATPSWEPLEHVACAVCGADAGWPLLEKSGMAVVRCERCGLVYVDPRPRVEAIAALCAAERYYRNANASAFGYPDYLAERSQLERFFERRLGAIERFKPQQGLLDVSCAIGILVDLARRRGWDAEGVDMSGFAIGECRKLGFPVHHGDLFTARLPGGTVDVAVLDGRSLFWFPRPLAAFRRLDGVLASVPLGAQYRVLAATGDGR